MVKKKLNSMGWTGVRLDLFTNPTKS